MALYKIWQDFVYYPRDPDRVKTLQERLNVSGALDPNSKDWEPEDAFAHGFIVKIADVVCVAGDEFEAMEVSDGGNVTIWTKHKVFYLNRRCNGIEKLTSFPRNPPSV